VCYMYVCVLLCKWVWEGVCVCVCVCVRKIERKKKSFHSRTMVKKRKTYDFPLFSSSLLVPLLPFFFFLFTLFDVTATFKEKKKCSIVWTFGSILFKKIWHLKRLCTKILPTIIGISRSFIMILIQYRFILFNI